MWATHLQVTNSQITFHAMKQCDLETVYSALASQLPSRTDGNESITLSSANLPLPPSAMATDNLYILKADHVYNDWFKVDQLWFFARKETYRYLGLLILSAVFHRISEIKIKVNHPHSEIKKLIVKYDFRNLDDLTAGYYTRPFAFEYYPQFPDKHPFDRCVSPKDLPCFELSGSANSGIAGDDWKRRDTVKIFGNDVGIVLFAELLLNFSVPHNEQDELQLESESGFRGIGVGSAEVQLFLPGHLAWMEEHWQENS